MVALAVVPEDGLTKDMRAACSIVMPCHEVLRCSIGAGLAGTPRHLGDIGRIGLLDGGERDAVRGRCFELVGDPEVVWH